MIVYFFGGEKKKRKYLLFKYLDFYEDFYVI